MDNSDPTVKSILAEQEQALGEINKKFHQTTFAERMKALFTGLSADKDSRAYKLARIEAQRLSAPALAVVIPCFFIGALILLATNQTVPERTWDVDIMDTEEAKELEKPEIEKIENPDMPDIDIEIDIDLPTPPDQPIMDTVTAQPADFNSVLDVKSPVMMKSMFASRNPGAIGMLVGKYNKGSQATEKSVMLALRWLKKNQNADGSWPNCKPAMTGLALLCFLAHDERPGVSEEFSETVQKAIEFLLGAYNRDGSRFTGSDGNEYAFPIAVYALCEAYGMTQIPNIKDTTEHALKRLINGQHPTGGWDYKMGTNPEWPDRDDTSYMGWCAQALKAAKMAKMFATDSEWAAKLDKACQQSNVGFLKNGHAGGGFGYTGPQQGGLTGVGTLCMQFHNQGNHPQVKASITLMNDWKPGWFSNTPELNASGMQRIGGCTQYYYYYATQAKFHESGKTFDDWNKVMTAAYTKAQFIEEKAIADPKGVLQDIGWWGTIDEHSDGHVFREVSTRERDAILKTEPRTPWKSINDRNDVVNIMDMEKSKNVMDTCLTALQLMVYYRYLPTSTKTAVEIEDEIVNAIATESGDVRLNIGNL